MSGMTSPALAATGASGELRHGYHVAARFGAWSFSLDRQSPSLTVTVSHLEPDGYWFQEQPQELRLLVGSRMWVWREAERIDDTHYRVTGDPEVI
jgi:hypothetical protein